MSTTFRDPGDDRNDDFWYNFGFDALEMTVESYSLDGHKGSHGLQEDRLLLDDVGWDTLTLSGTITLPDGLSDYVFEDGTTASEAGSVLVCGDCIATHNRFVADRVETFEESSAVPFEAEVKRESITGSVKLSPVLVRTSEPTTEDYLYGQTPGLKLADGPSFEVDTTGDDDEGSFLPIRTKPFEEEREGQVFYLDHSVAADPKLYINSDINLLASAMKTQAPYGSKRWTRETLQRLIGQSVWVELVLWTASDLSDGEIQYSWQEDVVGALAEVRDESPEEVAERLEYQIDDPDRVDTLVETTNSDVQEILEIDDPLESLLEEVL